MSAKLHLTRASRLADLVWPYQVVLDGQPAGEIRSGSTTQLELPAGTHTLQVRSLHIINRRLGLASPTATFVVGENEAVDFSCHPRPFVQACFRWFACLLGDRSQWIELTPANR
ncbi:MAG: hypothetical protein ACRDMJ_16105 [Solirubrobacteraceae bacterium]